jgi:hypothetical protein
LQKSSTSKIRQFETGANRDTQDGKLVYEAFFSPIVLRRMAEYMHGHRTQSNGAMRAGDNWQSGLPVATYQDSLVRHLVDAWYAWRVYGWRGQTQRALEDLLCAIVFNASGYLFELLKKEPHE